MSSAAETAKGGDVSELWGRVSSSALLSHFNSLYVAVSSVGLLPPVCEQIHLGVVDAVQFRTMMELLHTVGRQCREREASGRTGRGQAQSGEGDSSNVTSSLSNGSAAVPLSSPTPSSNSSQTTSPGTAAEPNHFPLPTHDALALPPSSSTSSSSSSSSTPLSPPTTAPPSSSSRSRSVRSAVFSPPPSARGDRDGSGVVERDRFCKPSRLITVYPSKPFLITPIHLERLYVTSRKAAESMSEEEKLELATVTVRWMGKPTADELFLVATDVCALINIRKSNTAKTVAQFADGEKVSMPVHCSSGKGSSTHILTVLTLAGVRRLLTTSRSVLATSLLEYLTRIAVHLQHFPHYVPVNDPLKPTVTPLKAEQQTQLVPNPAVNGLSPPLMPPPPPSTSADAQSAISSATESSSFPSLPYPPSGAHSDSTLSGGSAFMPPLPPALSSQQHDHTADVEHILGGTSSTSPLPPPLSASLPASSPDSSPPLSVSGATNGANGWTVKREHEEMDGGDNRSEQQDKKRKVDESGLDAAEQTQRRRPQYQSEVLDDNSPLPLPLVDDGRTTLYAPPVSRTLSSGQQSPSAPDSPSGLSYSNFHPSSLILPPLHYTHSPPFMATQPIMPFGEGPEMMYAPGPYYPPYYASSRQQHAYYLSPQHRPLTAPPMQPFAHHNPPHLTKPLDDYAGSALSQQQPHGAASGLHSPASVVQPASLNNGNISQHAANAELTLPPPLYQPTPQHTQSTCSHCQHTQHSSGGTYGNRRAPPPISPPPPPQLTAAATYHTAYSHPQLPPMQPQPAARSSFSYTGPSVASYAHSSHHTFHHARYTAS